MMFFILLDDSNKQNKGNEQKKDLRKILLVVNKLFSKQFYGVNLGKFWVFFCGVFEIGLQFILGQVQVNFV